MQGMSIPRKMYRVIAIRNNDFNKYNYCYYRKNEIFYVLGYKNNVYFTSTDDKTPFNRDERCGFVNADDFIILRD